MRAFITTVRDVYQKKVSHCSFDLSGNDLTLKFWQMMIYILQRKRWGNARRTKNHFLTSGDLVMGVV